jgi:Adenylate and Guanylate cyclase catalytic domain
VTVLFTDVSGFTSLSERLDPEDVHGFMTRAFELMLTEVHRYEGTVNQFLGDGIMALFGAPIALEDHTQRAVHAALGEYVLTRPPKEIALRATIQDVIMARIDRLEEGPKKTLQVASVIGRQFPRSLLDRIADSPAQIAETLRQLKAVELIYETSAYGEEGYVFKHALTQEATYGALLVNHRRELHQRIGLAIEELYADRLFEHYDVLAYHFAKAEQRNRALPYLLKAAEKAGMAYANREARALYEQALPLLADGEAARRAEVVRKLAAVTQYLGDADASLRYAESAAELCERLGDKRGAVAMHLHIQMLYSWQWDGAREDLGLKHLEAAAALVENDPDSVEKGLVYQRTGHLYLHRCEPTTTLAWAQRAVDMFARLGVPMGTSLGTALTYTGRIDEGIAYSERNWQPVLKGGVPVVMAVMGHELALTLGLACDVPRAIDWGERVLPHVVKTSPVFEAMLRRPLTLVYTLAGDVAKAEESCAAVERINATSMLGCIYEDAAAVGFHHLRRGWWDRARAHLELVLPIYEERNNIAAVNACSLVLGRLELELERFSRAEALLRRSLDLSRRGDNVLMELWVLPVLCELYFRLAQPDKAAEHLERARTLLDPARVWYGLPGQICTAQGKLAALRGHWEEAAGAFGKAVAIAQRNHLPWDEARARAEWGLMHLARGQPGDRVRAQEHLGASLEGFRRVGAEKDEERVLRRKEAAAST